MRLSDQEINDILASRKMTCTNLSEYKNMDSILHLECEQGHKIEASIRTVRNANFKCAVCEGQESLSEHISVVNVPKKTGYRIVAIDNATENVGIAVFDDGKLVYEHLFHFEGETINRMAKNRKFLEDKVLDEWEADKVVLEDIQYQNNNILVFKTLAMLLGSSIITIKLAGKSYETVLSKVWRAHFMIGGKTRIQQKKAAIDKVKAMYGITVVDDVAEAILLGKYAADMVKKPEPKKLF